ncbi:alpha/beta fold hydrolase [Sphingomonas soli]|uniref:alpha/beta fold hydrolase n=1 Tax=Sphingomonas soli TaxID=266127 RepID=UPI000A611A65|nr:alpha/beta hydrolase [Sphingomonas soli]
MIRHLRTAACRKGRLPLFAIMVAIGAASGSPAFSAPPQPAATQTASAPLIQMEHISVQVIGKGSPVILIPGLSSPRGVWDGVAPELAKKHSVYLVQVNGFGGDDPRANLKPGVLDGLVAELHQLIATRKLAKPAVIGHSLGGLAALMLAKAHPQDVGKAMIVDALPFVGSAFIPGSTVESIKPTAEAMKAQMAGLYGQPVPDAVLNAIANTNALRPASRETIKAWMAKADMRVSGQALYEDMMVDLRGTLGGITAPVTVLVPWTAARGEAAVLGFYRSEYAGAPKLTVTGVGDSGHFIMLDQPEAFRAALTGFLGD